MNYNCVTIAGNLTRDPELRWTAKGMAVCSGSLAINRKSRSDGGEQREEVTYVDFTAWGKTAENISKYFFKGKPVFLIGRLRTESWDDKQTGAKRSKLSVVVDSFQFVGDPERDAETAPPPAAQPNLTPPRRTEPVAAGPKSSGKAGDPQEDPDPLPF